MGVVIFLTTKITNTLGIFVFFHTIRTDFVSFFQNFTMLFYQLSLLSFALWKHEIFVFLCALSIARQGRELFIFKCAFDRSTEKRIFCFCAFHMFVAYACMCTCFLPILALKIRSVSFSLETLLLFPV